MKKIGLLSLDSHSFNYGGALQQYALFKVINDFGFQCEIINYQKNTEIPLFSYKRNLKYLTFDKIKEKIRNSKSFYIDDSVENIIKERHLLFESFRDEHISLTEQLNRNDLFLIQKKYNAIVCGSDQIWNPSLVIPSFFLDFVDEDNRKIIYAASIGRNALSKLESQEYKKYLSNIDHISVREKKAKEILNYIIPSKDIEVVLDPTLLIDKDSWTHIAGHNQLHERNYVFCYFLEISDYKKQAAIDMARKYNLDIVSIPFLQDRYNNNDVNFSNYTIPTGPSQFLNLILHADCVLTDSFHASVFSILFNRPFRVFSRGFGNKNMNSRIETLLSYIGKEYYLIEPSDIMKFDFHKIEQYDLNLIQIKKKQSLEWLYKSICERETYD